MNEQIKRKVLVGGGVLCLLWVIGVPNLFKSKATIAYERCVAVQEERLEMMKSNFPQFAQGVGAGLSSLACDMVRQRCQEDPDGFICNTAMDPRAYR